MHDFLNTSLSGAIFIFVILLLRALFKRRLPRTAFAALWLAAIFRLLCPVKIPFVASFWSLVEQDASSAVIDPMPAVMVTEFDLSESAGGNWGHIEILWAVVTVCLLMGIAVLYVHGLRVGRKARQVEHGVYVCEGLASPRVCGIIRPKILLPKAVNQQMLPYILLHERIHVQRLDNLWKLLALVTAAIHWFNPAAWVLVILLGRDLEVSCDEWALRRLGSEERSSYALSLIDIAERCEKRSPLTCGFSYDPLEERIRCIMKGKKSIAAICAAAAMILGATAVFATDAPADKDASKADVDKAAKLVEFQQSENGSIVENGKKESATTQEYEAYMAQEKERMKKQVAEGILSQENYEKTVKDMKNVLEALKNGNAVVMLIRDSDGNVTAETVMEGDLTELRKQGMKANVSMNVSTEAGDVESKESPERPNEKGEASVNEEVNVNLEAVE